MNYKNVQGGATSQEEYEYYMNEIERCFDYQAQNLDIDEIEISEKVLII